ncbi:MAG: AAA family ATPase, partial [Candidatus Binataceae bacterium]
MARRRAAQEESLFPQRRPAGQPLADRMRPESLEEVVGQEHLLGPGKLLSQVVAAGALPSMILWGPPGSGKTTIAILLAGAAGARLIAIGAVTAGVADLRDAVESARRQLAIDSRRTVVFIDEIHRWNRAQQDAILPHVE